MPKQNKITIKKEKNPPTENQPNNPTPLLGKFPKPSSLLGLTSPSSAIDPKKLKSGIQYLKSAGHTITMPIDPSKYFERFDYLFSNGSPKERAKALISLFKNPKVAAIIAARGGYGAIEILPHLDYATIKHHPKIIAGFSDCTAIFSAIWKYCSLVSLHCYCIPLLASQPKENTAAQQTLNITMEYLKGKLKNPYKGMKFPNIGGKEKASGRLIGGNLATFVSLLGSPYEASLDNNILFFEDVNEPPYKISRLLTQLELAGRLKKIAGVLIGDLAMDIKKPFDSPNGKNGPSALTVLERFFSRYKIPVLIGLPFGHCFPCYPLPFGGLAEISGGKLELVDACGVN
ncbi:MAG TPA: LD-carboxypeptidase [Oligoflexia bacterium]|nr:LD-carboxypeptidase [Oligoflexia bacterium]HMP27605.1 LD-carboxypeptidase [Oligoflexia bacterium]